MEGSSGYFVDHRASPWNFFLCFTISSYLLAGASPIIMTWSMLSISQTFPISQKSISWASLPSPPSGLMQDMKSSRYLESLEKLDCSSTRSMGLMLQFLQIMILCSKETFGILMLMIYSVREIVSLRMLNTAFRAAPIEPVPSIAITVRIVSLFISLQFRRFTASTSFEFSLVRLLTTSNVILCYSQAFIMDFCSSSPCLTSLTSQLLWMSSSSSIPPTRGMFSLERSSVVMIISKEPFLP